MRARPIFSRLNPRKKLYRRVSQKSKYDGKLEHLKLKYHPSPWLLPAITVVVRKMLESLTVKNIVLSFAIQFSVRNRSMLKSKEYSFKLSIYPTNDYKLNYCLYEYLFKYATI